MAAYILITREKTRDAAKLAEYQKLAAPSYGEHPVTVRAIRGQFEVLEGPAAEAVFVLEFPSYDAAKAWYHSEIYQKASEHRFQGGDYRFILTEGVPAQ